MCSARVKELAWNGLAFIDDVLDVSGRAPDTSDVVLTFHSVGEPGRFGNVSRERFREILRFAGREYEIADLPAVLDSTESKRVVVTFDDGWENVYRNALPVLEELKIPATVFLVSEYLNSQNFMSYEQVQTLVSSDVVTIGNHTRTHPHLSRIGNEAERENQIVGARDRLEELFDTEVSRFAYPSGDFDERVVEIVRASHDIAVTTMPRVVNDRYVPGGVDPVLVPRVKGHLPPRRLRWEMTDLASRIRTLADGAGLVSR